MLSRCACFLTTREGVVMLKGRIAVVTGASAGIGEAITRELVAQNAPVVMNARRADRLEGLRAELGAEDVCFVAGDAADPAIITQLLDRARETFGGGTHDADLVVVNAGRGLKGSVLDSDPAQWESLFRTNVIAAAHLMRQAAARLTADRSTVTQDGPWLKQPRDIIVIGSVVGRHLSPFSSMYGSTKFALHSLVEATRRELAPKGVRVSLVEPAFVKSEFQSVAGYDPKWFDGVQERIGPVLEPADVARLVTHIASLPARVHLGDVLLRPTRQDYP